jgi:translation initiation factor 2B subunit (eIF-2B alpha/beta/delta family)
MGESSGAMEREAMALQSFQELADDNTSGATELITRLLGLCETCTLGLAFSAIRKGLEALEQAQRSLPSLHTVINILRSEFLPMLEDDDLSPAISYLVSLQKILTESGETIALRFAELFSVPCRIVTLGRSSTVMSALLYLIDKELLAHLSVLESRPLNEGLKTLRDCLERGATGTLFADAAMAEAAMAADCAIVGADSVSADGFLLNKIGSHALAIVCRAVEIPFYVLCDSLKFSPQLRDQILVERHPEGEIVEKRPKDKFDVWNMYYEWTPVDLVTGFVTERGIFAPGELSGLLSES